MWKTISENERDVIVSLAAEKWLNEEIEHFQNIDTSEITDSLRVEKTVLKEINRDLRREKLAPFVRIVRAAGIVLISAVTILFALSMTIQPVRAAFWKAVVKWYDNYIEILFVSDDEIPTTIEEVIYPASLPDGLRIEDTCIGLGKAEYCITDGNNEIIYVEQSLIGDFNEIWYDNTDVNVTEIVLNQRLSACLLTYPDGMAVLNWSDRYVFEIIDYNGNVGQMISIAESFQ